MDEVGDNEKDLGELTKDTDEGEQSALEEVEGRVNIIEHKRTDEHSLHLDYKESTGMYDQARAQTECHKEGTQGNTDGMDAADQRTSTEISGQIFHEENIDKLNDVQNHDPLVETTLEMIEESNDTLGNIEDQNTDSVASAEALNEEKRDSQGDVQEQEHEAVIPVEIIQENMDSMDAAEYHRTFSGVNVARHHELNIVKLDDAQVQKSESSISLDIIRENIFKADNTENKSCSHEVSMQILQNEDVDRLDELPGVKLPFVDVQENMNRVDNADQETHSQIRIQIVHEENMSRPRDEQDQKTEAQLEIIQKNTDIDHYADDQQADHQVPMQMLDEEKVDEMNNVQHQKMEFPLKIIHENVVRVDDIENQRTAIEVCEHKGNSDKVDELEWQDGHAGTPLEVVTEAQETESAAEIPALQSNLEENLDKVVDIHNEQIEPESSRILQGNLGGVDHGKIMKKTMQLIQKENECSLKDVEDLNLQGTNQSTPTDVCMQSFHKDTIDKMDGIFIQHNTGRHNMEGDRGCYETSLQTNTEMVDGALLIQSKDEQMKKTNDIQLQDAVIGNGCLKEACESNAQGNNLVFSPSESCTTGCSSATIESYEQEIRENPVNTGLVENYDATNEVRVDMFGSLSKLSSYDTDNEACEIDDEKIKSCVMHDGNASIGVLGQEMQEQCKDDNLFKNDRASDKVATDTLGCLSKLASYEYDGEHDESYKYNETYDEEIQSVVIDDNTHIETSKQEIQDQCIDKKLVKKGIGTDQLINEIPPILKLASCDNNADDDDEVASEPDCQSLLKNFSPAMTNEENSLDELQKEKQIVSSNSCDESDTKYQDGIKSEEPVIQDQENILFTVDENNSKEEVAMLSPGGSLGDSAHTEDTVTSGEAVSAAPLVQETDKATHKARPVKERLGKWNRKEIIYDAPGQPRISDTHFTQVSGTDIANGSFSRVIFIGDAYISQLASAWPTTSNFKPYFIWQNTLKISGVSKVIFENQFIKRKIPILIIILLSLEEILIFKSLKCDSGHSPIRFPFHVMKKKVVPFIIEKMKKLMYVFRTNERFKNCTVVFGGYPLAELTHDVEDALNYDTKAKCHCSYDKKQKDIHRSNMDLENTIHTLNKGIYNRGFSSLYQFKHFRLPSFTLKYVNGRWEILEPIFNDFMIKLHDHLQFCIWGDVSRQLLLSSRNTESEESKGYDGPKRLDDVSVFFFGNSWYKSIAKEWPFRGSIKPYFYTSQKLKIEDIETFIMSEVGEQEEALVLASISINEFVSYKNYPGCSDHEPLVYPVLKDYATTRPIRFTSDMCIRLTSMLKRLAKVRKKCKLLFTTCYPVIFGNYYKFLVKGHLSLHEISVDERINFFGKKNLNIYMKRIVVMVNEMLISLNKANGLHTCDVYALVLKLIEGNMFTYPLCVPGISPAVGVVEKLTSLMQGYLDSIDMLFQQDQVDLFCPSEELLSLEDDFFECARNDTDEEEEDPAGNMKDLVITIKNTSSQDEDDAATQRNAEVLESDRDNDSETTKSRMVPPKISKSSESVSEIGGAHGKDNDDARGVHPKIEQFVRSSRESTNSARYNDKHDVWRDTTWTTYEKDRYNHRTTNNQYRYSRTYHEEQQGSYGSYKGYYPRHDSKYTSGEPSSKPYEEYSYYNPAAYPGSSHYKTSQRPRDDSPFHSGKYGKHGASMSFKSRSPYDRSRRSHKREHSSSQTSSSSRSRSRSPPRKSSKRDRESADFDSSVQEIALTNLRQIHDRECVMYRNNPEAHPDYNREKRHWVEVIQERGYNPYSPAQFNEWRKYWQSRIEDLFGTTWLEKKQNCLSLLPPSSKALKKYDSKHSRKSSSSRYSPGVKRSSRKSKMYSSDSSPERSPKHSKKKSTKSRKDSYESSRSFSFSKDESIEAINDLQRKIDQFMDKASVNFPRASTSNQGFGDNLKLPTAQTEERDQVHVTSVDIPLDIQLKEAIRVLSKMADRFGALSMSIGELNQKIFDAVNYGKDALDCVDEDAIILLGLINDKLDHMLANCNFNLVQKAIHTEAKEKVSMFLENFKREKDPYFGLNIEIIAKNTTGFEASRVISFIKSSLRYNQINHFTEDDMMKIYLAVKAAQISTASKYKAPPPPPHYQYQHPMPSSSAFPFNLSGGPMSIESSLHSCTPQSTSGALAPAQAKPSGYTHPLANLFGLSKRELIKKNFSELPMSDKIKKFVNFAKLEFEEKSFLLSHLEDLEKKDKDLAASLRVLITTNRNMH